MNVSLTPKQVQHTRQGGPKAMHSNAGGTAPKALNISAEQEKHGVDSVKAAPTKSAVMKKLIEMEPDLRKRGVTSLAIFGSVMRDEATPGSDIDLLAEINPSIRFSLLDRIGIKHDLESDFGCPVDFITRRSIHHLIREKVFAEAEQIF